MHWLYTASGKAAEPVYNTGRSKLLGSELLLSDCIGKLFQFSNKFLTVICPESGSHSLLLNMNI